MPAGCPAVRNAIASTGAQKNRAGQLGPRRSASRACPATIIAVSTGNPTSSTSAITNRTGVAGSNASPTLVPPRYWACGPTKHSSVFRSASCARFSPDTWSGRIALRNTRPVAENSSSGSRPANSRPMLTSSTDSPAP
ncbi:hypothetical protein BJF78_19070 [Pseudonocardia sp. CNS-139]|nr:hypothetical protein BJF78_19070 [Pseudonocardia sp. CNS-139]